jgi:DNA-binding protein HU-beta
MKHFFVFIGHRVSLTLGEIPWYGYRIFPLVFLERLPMTKAELVETVAAQTKLTKKSAAKFMNIVFNNISKAVKNDSRFSYPGFGTWSMRSRKARSIRNPQTNEMMKLKATKTIGFRPAKELKETL